MAALDWDLGRLGSQHGKRVVVTGANSGIGYHTALELARRGATVVMACRNPERGEQALGRLRTALPGALTELEMLDLGSLASVRKFAERELRNDLPLHVLINNAGVMAPPRRLETEDGFELQFGTNVLGHFLLTALLFPALLRAEMARVVTLSSIAHKRGTLRFDDPQWTKDYDPMASYAQSKLADLMFALELDRRLRGVSSTVTSVACHPGVANTNLFVTGEYGTLERILRTLASYAIGLFLNSESQGSLPSLFAATSSSAEGGGYYGPQGFREMRGGNVGVAEIRPQALDETAASRLWTLCEELTGVGFLNNG